MSDAYGGTRSALVVRSLTGDETVLCVAVRAHARTVIVVNERYSDALPHAERHVADGFDGVQICSIDCPG